MSCYSINKKTLPFDYQVRFDMFRVFLHTAVLTIQNYKKAKNNK